MKFISFAILSTLASLAVAAPAPSQGQCVPEQGYKYDFSYDMTGWYTFNECAYTTLQFESGVSKFRGAYNFVNTGSTYNYCSKSHANLAGGKAVDSEGNRYNVIQVSGGKYDNTYDASVPSSETDDTFHYKYKFVGQGQLANSVFTYTVKCHYSWNPTDGYTVDCKKNDWSFKCSA